MSKGIFEHFETGNLGNNKKETAETELESTNQAPKQTGKIYIHLARIVLIFANAGIFHYGYHLFYEKFALPELTFWNSFGIVLCALVLTRGILTKVL